MLVAIAALLPVATGVGVASFLYARAPRGAPELVLPLGHSRGVASVAFSPDGQVLASAGKDGAIKLWETASGAQLATLAAQAGALASVAFSPDGKVIAGAGRSGAIALWDTRSGERLALVASRSGALTSVAFSPDGMTLAAAGEDGAVELWDRRSLTRSAVLGGGAGAVTAVAFSPDGKAIATAGAGFVELRGAGRGGPGAAGPGALLRRLPHAARVRSVAFSPDGRQVATAGDDRVVKLWDSGSGELLGAFHGHAGAVTATAFGPGGALASAGEDGAVMLWDLGSRAPLRVQVHPGVTCLALSPDGGALASGSEDRSIRIWSVRSGAARELSAPRPGRGGGARLDTGFRSLTGHALPVTAVAISPDGKTLASASVDHTVRLWDAGSGAPLGLLAGHALPVTAVAFSPDGKTLASGGLDRSVRLWNVSSRAPLRSLTQDTAVTCLAFSPDGETLAAGTAGSAGDGRAPGAEVVLWAVRAGPGSGPRRLGRHARAVTSVAFSPDGEVLASGSEDLEIRLWDLASPSTFRTLQGHAHHVRSVAFSPDGKTLASGSIDTRVKIWDARSGASLQTLTGHGLSVLSVAYSPDGQRLASASADGSVRIWAAGSGALLRALAGHEGTVTSVAYGLAGPAGARLASAGDDGIKLWDGDPGVQRPTARGDPGPVAAIAHDARGGTLATAGEEGLVRLWDARTGALRRALPCHQGAALSVAFDREGRTLATGGEDGLVKLWDPESVLLLRALSFQGSITSVALSRDGVWLAAASGSGAIGVWDVRTGAFLHALAGRAGSAPPVAFHPDGRTLATGGEDGLVTLWDAERGTVLRKLPGHSRPVTHLAFSPGGEVLASAGAGGEVRLWTTSGGAPVRALQGRPGAVAGVGFSADGKALASLHRDGTVLAWEVASGSPRAALDGSLGEVASAAFSPDGTLLISAATGGTVTVREAETWAPRLHIAAFGGDWLSWEPSTLRYVSTGPAERASRVRFGRALRPLYPLEHYREELAASGGSAARSGSPAAGPRPFLLFWEALPRAWALVYGLLFPLICLGVLLWMGHREPLEVARRFFKQALFHARQVEKGALAVARPGEDEALVARWSEVRTGSPLPLDRLRGTSRARRRLYVVYDGPLPDGAAVHQLRRAVDVDVVLLSSRLLERALGSGTSATRLVELELPYLGPADPYEDRGPMDDPNWFFGRKELLARIQEDLARGRHAGLFGLRKIGKTSVQKQLRDLAQSNPIATVDCQGLAKNAVIVLRDILDKLKEDLRRLGVRVSGVGRRAETVEEARAQLDRLRKAWRRWGGGGRFIVVLDEVDALLRDRRAPENEPVLREFALLFQVLRAECDARKDLSLLVIAKRPDANRQNQIAADLENPVFMFFTEHSLGNLTEAETEEMLQGIGRWKDIEWDPDALALAYQGCAGHPLLARFLASTASDRGARKRVEAAHVEAAMRQVREGFRIHPIGDYYREGVWDRLQAGEREILQQLSAAGPDGQEEVLVRPDLRQALTRVEALGLVVSRGGRLVIAGSLLLSWLQQQEYR